MKNIKIIVSLVLIILAVGIATILGGENVSAPDGDTTKVVIYYVPVVSYFSNRTNLSPSDLAAEKLLVMDGDYDALSKLLGAEILERTDNRDALLQKVAEGRVALIRWNETTPNLKTLSYKDKYLWKKNDVQGYELGAEVSITEGEVPEHSFDPAKLTKINFLGDIMLSRHVNTQINRFGYDYPWEKVREEIADADITFANLEVPLSDRFKAPAEGMSFIAPTKNLEYIKSAGIDIVSVANNHTANFGKQVFLDNLTNLKSAGISVCGGGDTESVARAATTITKNGTAFSFLCQSAITGSLYANGESAGVPYLGIEPWYRKDQNSLEKMVSDINKAVAEKAVVIDSPHWGVEYKHNPNTDQQTTARMMIDAGVDLIIGTHPHVVQASEYYKDRYISYSLGNFIFDQEWSQATKQGVMASAYFYGDKNVAVNLVPLQIENYAQPRFVTGATAQKIIGDIEVYSKGF